ncbi:MAG: zinc ribbon domain-containing protein [Candidatus Omnitrophica bacterium]|nr:zinc ribbon domain-containing protein [Candidatus Omnitrophota bacterium]
MPTYEYECNKCGHKFEAFQQMTAESLKKCPECSGKVRRLIGVGAGFIFKGSGFYATDHRSDSYKKKEKEENGPSTCPAKKENSKACQSCDKG